MNNARGIKKVSSLPFEIIQQQRGFKVTHEGISFGLKFPYFLKGEQEGKYHNFTKFYPRFPPKGEELSYAIVMEDMRASENERILGFFSLAESEHEFAKG